MKPINITVWKGKRIEHAENRENVKPSTKKTARLTESEIRRIIDERRRDAE